MHRTHRIQLGAVLTSLILTAGILVAGLTVTPGAMVTEAKATEATVTGAMATTEPSQSPVLPGDLSVHLGTIPDGSSTYASVLKNAVQLAIAHQSSAGSFEIQGKTVDLGDNSLGVSSLLALYHSQTGDKSVVAAFQKSVDWFLANRVYTYDNSGDPYIKVFNSGKPWAAYEPYSIQAGGGGDWPTTVWAFLHVGNILEYGDGVLRSDQQASLIKLGLGYWDWLTDVSEFNPQDADNQAIASVVGALQLSKQLIRLGQTSQGQQVDTQAMSVYTNQVRPLKQTDRGYSFYPEHSAGFDQNYGGTSVSDLWRAWKLTGDQRFYDDALEMAKYLDMRLGARGFDYGGPRHNEDHPGFEALYGLQHFSGIIKDDLGRYLGTASIPYYHVGTEPDGVVTPDGHFAFVTVWQMTDPSTWYQTAKNVDSTYKLRQGAGSVVLDANQDPYLISAGNADVIQAATSGVQLIGPAYADSTGTHFFTPAPNTTPASRSSHLTGAQGRVVTQQMIGPKGATVTVTTTYRVTSGTVQVTVSVPAGAIPSGVTLTYIAGLPYLTDLPTATTPHTVQQKILGVTGISTGKTLSFGADGASLTDAKGVTAGPLAITSPRGITVANPGSASAKYFSDSATLGLTLEQYSSALAGNPNEGWAQTRQTNLLEAAAQVQGSNLVTDVTYGPAS